MENKTSEMNQPNQLFFLPPSQEEKTFSKKNVDVVTKASFKTYHQNQPYLIPPSWEDKIPFEHPVRIVNKVIDSIDLSDIYRSYSGGGCSSYDPKMLLKGLVYCYMLNIYSSRKIEEAIKSNIYLIWLCGGNEPDHNTINRFRLSKLTSYLKGIFKQIVLLLESEGMLSLKALYIDGTKIEANANRYTFVWAKNISKNKSKIVEQIDSLWSYTLSVAASELSESSPVKFHEVDSKTIEQTIQKIDQALKNKPVSQEIKKKLQYAKKNYISKYSEYETKEKILNGRNSYSKTDTSAIFMRMKEDHLGSSQLKPAYNLQVSSNNQIITNYCTLSNPNDTKGLPIILDDFDKLYGFFPKDVTTDSGYGSEENYDYLSSKEIDAYVKYNTYYQEESGKRQKNYPFLPDYLYYNSVGDYYVCPMGQHMHNIGIKHQKSIGGCEKTITLYAARNCNGCPLRGKCFKGSGNRVIEINNNLNRHKQKIRENLKSELGLYYRSRRSVDIEPIFGNLKQNKKLRRFSLRGEKKVLTEFGLFAIAHNLGKKIAKKINKN